MPDIEDNCKYIDNSDQLDTDGDAAGMILTYYLLSCSSPEQYGLVFLQVFMSSLSV